MRIGTTKIASGLLWSSWLWLGVDKTPDNDAIVGRGSQPTETAVAGCGTGRAPYDRVASKPSRAEDAPDGRYQHVLADASTPSANESRWSPPPSAGGAPRRRGPVS